MIANNDSKCYDKRSKSMNRNEGIKSVKNGQ